MGKDKDYMKIREVNTYFVRLLWGFMEFITEEGLSGWGEGVLEGHTGTVLACVQEMKAYLIGADPANIEDRDWGLRSIRNWYWRRTGHPIAGRIRCGGIGTAPWLSGNGR